MKMRIAALLACALLCLLPARAAEPIDTTQPVSLTIYYHDGTLALSGAKFSVYHIASSDANGALTPAEDFAAYADDIANSDNWRTLAATLQSHVLRADSHIQPTASGTTDAHGKLTVSDLIPGLYLVTGQRLHTDDSYYDVSPFLVQLPTANENGTWNYDVTVDPKNASQPTPSEGYTVARKVLKVWDDAGFEDKRPPEIVVQLVREDGMVYDTVALSEENGWRYTWEGLDAQYRWFIAEQTPSGYRMELTQEGVTFVITNHYTSSTPDTPYTPDTPDTPDAPGTPVDEQNTPDTPILPQTGQLWWPVPLLVAAGLALLSVGLARRRHDDA